MIRKFIIQIFIGFDIYEKTIPIEKEECNICTNNCKIKVTSIKEKTVAYGFLCGRDYDTKKYINNKSEKFTLPEIYDRAFHFKQKKIKEKNITIGIPAALHMMEDLHLWKKFFNILGVETIISDNSGNFIETGKKISNAEFCAPVISMHGHVDYLLNKSDYIFLPVYGHSRTKIKNVQRQYCYYTLYTPPLSEELADNKNRIISPFFSLWVQNFSNKNSII